MKKQLTRFPGGILTASEAARVNADSSTVQLGAGGYAEVSDGVTKAVAAALYACTNTFPNGGATINCGLYVDEQDGGVADYAIYSVSLKTSYFAGPIQAPNLDGMSIGSPVAGADPNVVLFVDGAGDLAQLAGFTFDGSTLKLTDPGEALGLEFAIDGTSGGGLGPSVFFGPGFLSFSVDGVTALVLRSSTRAVEGPAGTAIQLNSGDVGLVLSGVLEVAPGASSVLTLTNGGATSNVELVASNGLGGALKCNGFTILELTGGDASAKFGSYLNLVETTVPGAPSANEAFLYCQDNGAGKTQIVARFPTGAVQVIATEP
jgi:hypothetical protein